MFPALPIRRLSLKIRIVDSFRNKTTSAVLAKFGAHASCAANFLDHLSLGRISSLALEAIARRRLGLGSALGDALRSETKGRGADRSNLLG